MLSYSFRNGGPAFPSRLPRVSADPAPQAGLATVLAAAGFGRDFAPSGLAFSAWLIARPARPTGRTTIPHENQPLPQLPGQPILAYSAKYDPTGFNPR
ncbi:hypothetical protein [Burkholderia seminalis]|uniref:hypothetical protein n=1 Tax=Burkholderia seminalis TaxID=488731 RepID=UPI0012E3E8FE|nr:hypothetical protein [Burkholderia seminalis]MCA8039843.1 hypothetical protein [Burkholderia seminalis]